MEPTLVKVTFDLDPNEWHGSATESLWAEPLGNCFYRIRNVPFFVRGVSHEDVVVGRSEGLTIKSQHVEARGGHSTYRVRLLQGGTHCEQFARYWSPIKAQGCTYEEGRVVAVDVPPAADIYAVYSSLEAGAKAGVWDFEEGHCGHALNEK